MSFLSDFPPVRWAEVLPAVARMSADDLMALPEDRWRYELVAGHLVRLSPADLRFDIIVGDLLRALGRFVADTGLGGVTLPDTGFVVSPPSEEDTVFVPALAFVRAERMPDAQTTQPTTYMRLVPDLVIEIATPGQQRPELADKALLWLAAGARLVWVVWPGRRQVDTWQPEGERESHQTRTLSADGTLEGGAVVPGFTYRVAHLFL